MEPEEGEETVGGAAGPPAVRMRCFVRATREPKCMLLTD